MNRHWLEENRLLLGFILLSVTSGISAGFMQLLFPLFALSLNIGDGGIGLLRGVGQLGGLLTTLPGGFLIDRYGARRIYVISGLLNVLAICLIPTAATFSLLLVFLVIEGLIGSIRWTALNTAFFERLSSIGIGRAGWMRAAMAIGLSLIGPLLAGRLATVFSFQVNFLLIALFILVPIGLLLVQSTLAPPSLHLRERDATPLREQFRSLLRNRLLMSTALNQSLSMSCFNAFSVFIILLLVKTLHIAPANVSLLIAVQGIGFVLVMFGGGILIRNFSRPSLYAACYFLQILALLAVGCSDRLWLIWIGSISLGIGCGLMTTMSYTVLGNMTGKKGKITGIFYFITGAGIALGPIFGGLLAAQFGIRAAFTGFLPLECAALGYFLLLLFKRERRESFSVATLTAEAAPVSNS